MTRNGQEFDDALNTEMNQSETIEALLLAGRRVLNGKRRRPVMMHGHMGIGKSDFVRQVRAMLSEECGEEWGLSVIMASLLDPTDLRGVPAIIDGTAKWCPPSILPIVTGNGNGSWPKYGILFFDELLNAPPLVQGACYQAFQDYRIGEHELFNGWIVVGAGNLDTSRGVTHRMPMPLGNRCFHIYVKVDDQPWFRWALENGIAAEVLAYIRLHPDHLFAFDPKSEDLAFPTPRSWHILSDFFQDHPRPQLAEKVYSGIVGRPEARQFVGWLDIMNHIPNPDAVILDPHGSDLPNPDKPGAAIALVTALGARACKTNIDAIYAYAKRLEPEYCSLLMKDATRRDKSLITTREFIDWGVENSDLMIGG